MWYTVPYSFLYVRNISTKKHVVGIWIFCAYAGGWFKLRRARNAGEGIKADDPCKKLSICQIFRLWISKSTVATANGTFLSCPGKWFSSQPLNRCPDLSDYARTQFLPMRGQFSNPELGRPGQKLNFSSGLILIGAGESDLRLSCRWRRMIPAVALISRAKLPSRLL